jgi:hypothetical protein
MKHLILALGLAPLTAAVAGERRISLFTAVDIGRLEKGYDMQYSYNPSGLALNRTYVDVGFFEQLDEHYQLNVGVGGIFWKSYEQRGGNPEDKAIKFGPGISNASLKWSPSEKVALTLGYFPYKYNAATRNLGEYLFRSEAYPTILYTGGWSWLNDVQYRAVGALLTFNTWDGRLKQDIGLFGEYFNSPIYDMTPAYIATLKPTNWFTVGGAGSLHRFISPTPKTKEELTKAHAYRENFWLPEVQSQNRYLVNIPEYVGTSGYDVKFSAAPNLDSLKNAIWASESALLTAYNINSAAEIPLSQDTSAQSTRAGRPGKHVTWLESDIILQAAEDGSDSATYFGHPNNQANQTKSVSFDLAAVKLLAFFELDFNNMLGLEESEVGKFNLYGEVAQLGLKNYPIFYTRYEERRPMMLGFSVPTFGLLNNLSFEVEYLKNPNAASIRSTYDKLDLTPDEEFRYEAFADDDVKWSLHASRALSKFFSVYFQVANDHMRLKDGYARPNFVPVTNEGKHWYWLTRLQWMI